MITGVAFVPQAPALVPEVGRGLDAELGPVRDACRAAIRRVAVDADRIVIVGAADTAGEYGAGSRGSLAGFGVDIEVSLGPDEPGPVELPPSLTVGAWLVRDALGPGSGATGLATADGFDYDSNGWRDDRQTVLIVVGDGSAKRSEKAPGHLDVRAADFDAAISTALRLGDGSALHHAHEDAAAELMMSGVAAWELVAWEIEAQSPWVAELMYGGAPFGVGYFVATWISRVPNDELWRRHKAVLDENERWANDPGSRRRTVVRIVG